MVTFLAIMRGRKSHLLVVMRGLGGDGRKRRKDANARQVFPSDYACPKTGCSYRLCVNFHHVFRHLVGMARISETPWDTVIPFSLNVTGSLPNTSLISLISRTKSRRKLSNLE